MPGMSVQEMKRFLRGAHIAKLATAKRGGWPYVVPVWYEWDGKNCYVVGRKKSDWIGHIKNDPRVTILIDEPEPPYHKVIIEGIAKVVGVKLSDWVGIGKKMVKRYYGPAAGISYLKGSLDQPRVTIRITPRKISTWVNPTDREMKRKPRLAWHPRYYAAGTKWSTEYRSERRRH